MSGIYHEWNGTILTITSDSGTSSCDLKGDKGDDGIRGAQGIAGRDGRDGDGASVETDTTLTKEGAPADAMTVGKVINDLNELMYEELGKIDYPVDSVNGKTGAVVLSASDVGALPADTVIPSTSGLATETYVNNAVSAKQNKVFYQTSQPTNWVNGDIWLKPAN